MPFNSTPITVLDGAAASKSMIAYNDGTSSAMAHPLLDATGAIISPATSGNQTTANSSLASIVSNTTGLATAAGQSTGNTSLASVVTNTGNLDTNLGAKADSAASSDTGTFSIIALLKRALQSLTAGNTSLASIATNTTSIATAALQTTANTKLDTVIANTNNSDVLTYSALGGTGNALLTATAVAVKAAAGSLCGVNFVNTGAADAYVQVFNVASGSVTLGTTVPKLAFWVPAGGAWEEKFKGDCKIAFSTAITVAATTTATGSTAPGTGILANIIYK